MPLQEKPKQWLSGPAGAAARRHEKVVSEDHCFLKVLVNPIILVKNILKFIEIVLKGEHDFEISEFYRIQTF